ncbi:MAG: hypothetical protein ABIR63_03665 [Sphingomicrobium sp.]
MSKTPFPERATFSVRSPSQLAEALADAETQLDSLGDAVDEAVMADLRARIAGARSELGQLERRGYSADAPRVSGSDGPSPQVPPFWKKFLDS